MKQLKTIAKELVEIKTGMLQRVLPKERNE